MKKIIKNVLRKIGYDIVSFNPGLDPYYDIQKRIKSSKPVIFDVGANQGQTVVKLKKIFPSSSIHAFEPSPGTFSKLKDNTAGLENAFLWNYGVGSSEGKLNLNENQCDDMSSFLELGEKGWGKVEKQVSVDVVTLDRFLEKHQIETIDLLKIDTQGFELEVLKGALQTLQSNQVRLLYFEVNFAPIYKGLPSFTEVIDYCTSNGFDLVAIYPCQYIDGKAAWTDMLFINRSA